MLSSSSLSNVAVPLPFLLASAIFSSKSICNISTTDGRSSSNYTYIYTRTYIYIYKQFTNGNMEYLCMCEDRKEYSKYHIYSGVIIVKGGDRNGALLCPLLILQLLCIQYRCFPRFSRSIIAEWHCNWALWDKFVNESKDSRVFIV